MESAILTECWNGFLKAQKKHQLKGNTANRWDAILWDTVYTLNQRPPDGTESPIERMHQSGKQGVADGVVPSAIILNDLPGGFCISYSCPFGLYGARVLVTKGEALLPEDTAKPH